MCGRFAAQLPPEFIARLFATTGALPNTAPNWNIGPRQDAMVVRRHPQTGERRLDVLNWGLLPHFTLEARSCPRPINARAETVARAPLFRGAFAARRCLVPADAFYEWQSSGGTKQPWAFARADGAPLALAGLWESWRAPDGGTLRSFALLTTAANADMAPVHHRMPVIIARDSWPAWLGAAPDEAAGLLAPAPPGSLRAWRVGRDVGNVRHNGPALLAPAEDAAAGTLL